MITHWRSPRPGLVLQAPPVATGGGSPSKAFTPSAHHKIVGSMRSPWKAKLEIDRALERGQTEKTITLPESYQKVTSEASGRTQGNEKLPKSYQKVTQSSKVTNKLPQSSTVIEELL